MWSKRRATGLNIFLEGIGKLMEDIVAASSGVFGSIYACKNMHRHAHMASH